MIVNRFTSARAAASLILLALALAACASEPIDPSPESAFLQDRLIPRMIEWGKGKSEALPIGKALASQGFEKICTVAQYERITEFEAEVPGIASTHGSVSSMVPENRIAIVGVKGNAAHVGYIRATELLVRNKLPRCSSAANAILIRSKQTKGPDPYPEAFLEESEAIYNNR